MLWSSNTKRARSLASCAILAVLMPQSIALLTGLVPRSTFATSRWLGMLRAPQLYPFVDYPMYSRSYTEGECINRYRVVAKFDDGSSRQITHEDFGLTFWIFERGLVAALRNKDHNRVAKFVRFFNSRHDYRITDLHLENHGLRVFTQGTEPAPPVKLAQFHTHLEDFQP